MLDIVRFAMFVMRAIGHAIDAHICAGFARFSNAWKFHCAVGFMVIIEYLYNVNFFAEDI